MDPQAGHIPYPSIIKETLRGVIPRVLAPIAESGELPGEHHFYISFKTPFEGVQLPAHLRAQYPDTMTIVIQHQFTNLHVDDAGFGVQLTFGGRASELYIPYEAITAFVDPSTEFAIQFDAPDLAENQTQKQVSEVPKAEIEKKTQPEGKVVQVDFSRKK